MRAVLPPDMRVLPVGGISPDTMAAWHKAGAAGFGIGSALYSPGSAPDDVAIRAKSFKAAWEKL